MNYVQCMSDTLRRYSRRWSPLAVLALLFALLAPPAQAATRVEPEYESPQPPTTAHPQATIQEAPSPLVTGGATNFTLAGPKLFWHVDPDCPLIQPHIAGSPA